MAGHEQYYVNIAPMTDTADLFIRIGFPADVVRLTNCYDGQRFIWNRCMHGHTGGAAATGGIAIGVTGGAAYLSTGGVALCKFIEPVTDLTQNSTDPVTVDSTEYIDANGIKLASSLAMLSSGCSA